MFDYLSQTHILFSVTIPWVFIICWYLTEGKKAPPSIYVVVGWMLCTVATFLLSKWTINSEVREIHVTDVFFIFLGSYLYVGKKLSAPLAYALSFLSLWIADMAKAMQLVAMGLESYTTFYWGVGGAGYEDALCIFPLIAALLVHYVSWRRK